MALGPRPKFLFWTQSGAGEFLLSFFRVDLLVFVPRTGAKGSKRDCTFCSHRFAQNALHLPMSSVLAHRHQSCDSGVACGTFVLHRDRCVWFRSQDWDHIPQFLLSGCFPPALFSGEMLSRNHDVEIMATMPYSSSCSFRVEVERYQVPDRGREFDSASQYGCRLVCRCRH